MAFAANAPKLKAEPRPATKVPALNYRHHFHAGNFADVMKHGLWLQLLVRLTADPAPLTVIDTHAGAGLYDLEDAMARRSGEADAGVGRLMTDETAPAVFDPLKAAVRAVNPKGGLRFYPGSPLLTVAALRRGDRYDGCELRAEDQEALRVLLARGKAANQAAAGAILTDGYEQLGRKATGERARLTYLIDAPFERGDEYDQIVTSVARALEVSPASVFAIWAPLKDLETFDALLRRLEALKPSSLLAAEARLRPMLNPMTMNGSAMILIGAPNLSDEAAAICEWVAKGCGDEGAKAVVRKLGR